MNKKMNKMFRNAENKTIAGMKKQIQELTDANEKWKCQVQEMRKQIVELTIVSQRREHRRSAQAKGPCRSVSTQVDVSKAQAAQQGLVKQVPSARLVQTGTRPAAAPAAAASVSTPVSIAPATGTNLLIPVSSVPPGSAVTLLTPSSLQPASANIVGSQIRMITQPTVTNSGVATLIPTPASQHQQMSVLPPNPTVKQMLELKKQSPVSVSSTTPKAPGVIDLTDDDDMNKVNKTQVVTVSQRPGVNLAGAMFVRGPSGAPVILQPINNPQVRGNAPTSTIVYQRPAAPLIVQGQTTTITRPATTPAARRSPVHPAPLPASQAVQKVVPGKPMPPKPTLKINRVQQGIVLSWNMSTTEGISDITNYQLFAYQEGAAAPSSSLWKKVGDVKALPLPMACTLTQFQVGNKYHFAVRAVDGFGRVGDFSDASSIHLERR